MRFSTSFSIAVLVLRAAAQGQDDRDFSNIIVPLPTIPAIPVQEAPSSVPEPPAATPTLPVVNPIEPVPSSTPVEIPTSKVPEITTPPAPAPTSEKKPEEMTSTTEQAAPETTKTVYSTAVITETPTAETQKPTTTAEPSPSVVPFEGGANALGSSIQCMAVALMGLVGVFAFA